MTLDGVQPRLEDLPCFEYTDGAKIYIAADLPQGGRAQYLAHGGLEILHTNVIPAGAMLVVAPPEVASGFRPLKAPARRVNAGRLATLVPSVGGPLAPVVEVGPLRIPILVDVAQDLDVVLTWGVAEGGVRIAVPMIPSQSMVALFVPELANHVRALVRKAVAAMEQARRNPPNGPAIH